MKTDRRILTFAVLVLSSLGQPGREVAATVLEFADAGSTAQKVESDL